MTRSYRGCSIATTQTCLHGFAAHVTVTGETDAVRRPDLSYDPAATSSSAFVNIALLRYHVKPSLEIAGGRDQLPTGINLPDPRLFIKARDRAGYYDTPTQLKVYWAGSRHRLTPFIYGPAGNEAEGEGESAEEQWRSSTSSAIIAWSSA